MSSTHTIRRASVGLGMAAVVVGGGMAATAAPAADAPAIGFSMLNTNQEAYWEAYLEDMGYTDVTCTKEEFNGPGAESYTLSGTPPEGTEFVLLVLKAGSGEGQNDLEWNPVQGQTYEHDSGKDISHVILCSGVAPEETSTTTTGTSTTTTDTGTSSTTTDTGTSSTTSDTGTSSTTSDTGTSSTTSDTGTSSTTSDTGTSSTTSDTATSSTTSDTGTSSTTSDTGTSSTTTSATTTGGTAPTGPIVETDGVTAADNTWALVGGLSVMLAGAGLAASGLRRRADES